MSFEQQVQLSLIVLLTGLVIVFVVLVFLTYIIKGYGTVISKIQAGGSPKKDIGTAEAAPARSVNIGSSKTAVPAEAGIPEEVIAAISAAVYMTYGASAGTITSIRRASQPARSAWAMAGLLDNTRPF